MSKSARIESLARMENFLREAIQPKSDFDIETISDSLLWETRTLTKAPAIAYHGTTKEQSEKIRQSGHLRNDQPKVSAGTRDEAGLIWVATGKEIAELYAKGVEQIPNKPIVPGEVFRVKLPKNLRIIDRSAKLTQDQVDKILNMDKNKEKYEKESEKYGKEYMPYKAGMSLNKAIGVLIRRMDNPFTFAEVLPVLGYDAISYSDTQLGINAKSLPVILDDKPKVVHEPERTAA